MIREEVFDYFSRLRCHRGEYAEECYLEYFKKLAEYLGNKERTLVEINNEAEIHEMKIFTEDSEKIIKKKVDNDSFKISDLSIISDDFSRMLDRVLAKCVGIGEEVEPVKKIISTLQ